MPLPLTSAEKQARRRENYWRMREALEMVAGSRTLREAQEFARQALTAVPANKAAKRTAG